MARKRKTTTRKPAGLSERAAVYTAAPAPGKKARAKSIFQPADPVRTFDLTISVDDARRNFAQLLSRVARAKRRVVLTRGGKPLVCVIPMLDVDFIEELEDIADGMAVDEANKEWAKDGYKTVSIEELAKKHGIDLER